MTEEADMPAVEEAKQQHWAIPLVKPAATLLALAATWMSATYEGRKEAGAAKDKAESGYQATKQAVERLQEAMTGLGERFTRLEAKTEALDQYVKRQKMSAAKRRAAAAAAAYAAARAQAAAPSPPVVTPLPNDLDKALVQQQAKP